ncbi:MAG: hypothetical protein ACTSWX_10040 [Promethearchaeota archaeon]
MKNIQLLFHALLEIKAAKYWDEGLIDLATFVKKYVLNNDFI